MGTLWDLWYANPRLPSWWTRSAMGYKGYGLSEIWVPTVVQNSDGRIRPFYANTSVFDPADHLVLIILRGGGLRTRGRDRIRARIRR